MEHLRVSRPVMGVLVAVAMLAGCGGVGSTATVPQRVTTQPVTRHATSSSYGDLLYVSQSGNAAWNIVMLTYPQGKNVGTIVPPNQPWNICSDRSGNVWMPAEQLVYEYAHGGTSPIQTLSASYVFMDACAVDPTTGNVAVVGEGIYGTGMLAVWSGGHGTPTIYTMPLWGWSLTYDDSGNLFIDGNSLYQEFLFVELPKGSSSFQNITLDKPAKRPAQLIWDGKYLALGVETPARSHEPKHVVYRVQVSGSNGHVVGIIALKGYKGVLGSTIFGKTIAVAEYTKGSGVVDFWNYPHGGKAFQQLTGFSETWGLAISVAPTRSRIRK